jgi:glutamyl-tRNA synthetase
MSKFTKVRTRIAPSPTGNLHLGTIRTALYNLLFARQHQGDFYFRLEDTDRERSKQEFTDEILAGFKWLGIEWDQPDFDVHGLKDKIVYQSTRQEIQQKYINQLLESKRAYRCFATPAELDEMRAEQRKRKEVEKYDNRSRNLEQSEIEANMAAGKSFVIRLNLDEDRDLSWQDLVRGEMKINTKDLGGDPVIQKFNGQVLYNFAVVVDDAEMHISHVIRGEDHISNTAKQIAIYQALDFEIPQFAHLPLVFTKDKQKLSKRKHGDIASIDIYKDQGYLPEALCNYLVASSYNSAKYGETFTISEGAEDFNISTVSKSPAIYDIQKINWYNREYINKLSYEEVLSACQQFSKFNLKENDKYSDEEIKTIITAIQDSLNKFDEIDQHIEYFFTELEAIKDSKMLKCLNEGSAVLEELHQQLNSRPEVFNDAKAIKDVINTIGEQQGLKAKQLFWPIRIALSATTRGPDLGLIAHLLGKEVSLKRIKQALEIQVSA